MIPVLTAEDVRRQDAESPFPISQLMQNAGWAVARAARRMMNGTYGRRVVAVCGKGNNGGDGLVAARILQEHGAHSTVVVLAEDLSPLAAEARARFRGNVAGIDALERELARADLVIDAIFGVGLTRPIEGDFKRAVELLRGSRAPILAVDVPSGLDEHGMPCGIAVTATVTVTFTGPKRSLVSGSGPYFAGRIEVAGIGVSGSSDVNALQIGDISFPFRGFDAHKRNSGIVLVVAGSRAMPGAAALVSSMCVRAGAGLTILAAPESVCRSAVSRVPEITTIPIPETSEGTLDEKALDLIRPRFGELDALAVGPGLTTHPATVDAVRALVAEAPVPVVADADALNALVGAQDLLRARTAPAVITPHAGELARLTGRPSSELSSDRIQSALVAARDLNAIVLFKGPGTVIAGPQGEAYVNLTGGPALAQGGSGDVLTGLLASLIAQWTCNGGELTVRRVAVGAWIHGTLADRAAARLGERYPVRAGALIEELEGVRADVAAAREPR